MGEIRSAFEKAMEKTNKLGGLSEKEKVKTQGQDANIVSAPLEQAWKYRIGGLQCVMSQGLVLIGQKDTLHAISATSGEEKWSIKLNNKIVPGSITAHNLPDSSSTIVCVVTEDNCLHAVDCQTGAELWRFSTHKIMVSGCYPTTAIKAVYVEIKDEKSKDCTLCALDVRNGLELWRFSTQDTIFFLYPDKYHEMVFLITGSTSWIRKNHSCLYALSADSGAKLWQFEPSKRARELPFDTCAAGLDVSGDKLLAILPYTYSLYCLSIQDGTVFWEKEHAGNNQASQKWSMSFPKVVGDTVFCSTYLAIVDLATGIEKSQLLPERLPQYLHVNDGTIIVEDRGGLDCFDANTGKLKWSAFVGASKDLLDRDRFFRWVVAKEWVFVAQGDTLWGINTSRFTKRWSLKMADPVFDLHIYNGMLLVLTGNSIHAFQSSQDASAKAALEPGDKISQHHDYKVTLMWHEVTWPNCCCLCCGPAEVRGVIDYSVEGWKDGGGKVRQTTSLRDVPHCSACYKKAKGLLVVLGSGGGVKFLDLYTLGFKNERYWAMFMEANHLR